MNPCDHPHGGGRPDAPIGRSGPVTPLGKPALASKTPETQHKRANRCCAAENVAAPQSEPLADGIRDGHQNPVCIGLIRHGTFTQKRTIIRRITVCGRVEDAGTAPAINPMIKNLVTASTILPYDDRPTIAVHNGKSHVPV